MVGTYTFGPPAPAFPRPLAPESEVEQMGLEPCPSGMPASEVVALPTTPSDPKLYVY